MQAGKLDQVITFESLNAAREATYNSITEAWAAYLTCAAELQFSSIAGGEQAVANQVQTAVRVKVRTRYYAGIVPTMRINHAGKYYRILDVMPVGRNEELRITATEWNEGRR